MKLFTKTYAADLPWLELAVVSVAKTCQEEVAWLVVVEREDLDALRQSLQRCRIRSPSVGRLRVKVCTSEEKWPECVLIENGYLKQQWVKMNCHRVCGDDLVWHWDSDVIAMGPFSSKSFCAKNQKPVMWYSEMDYLLKNKYPPERALTVARVLQRPVHHEYMRMMPIASWGWMLRMAEKRDEWKRALQECREGNAQFSEFNVMGAFAHFYHPNGFDWRDAEKDGPIWQGGLEDQDRVTHQAWSHGGMKPEYPRFVERLKDYANEASLKPDAGSRGNGRGMMGWKESMGLPR